MRTQGSLRLPQRLCARCPFHWTQVSALKRLHNAQDFLYRASYRARADQRVFDHSFWVDDEEAAFGETVDLVEDLVVARDAVGGVGQDWVLHVCQVALEPSFVAPF